MPNADGANCAGSGNAQLARVRVLPVEVTQAGKEAASVSFGPRLLYITIPQIGKNAGT